MTKISMENIQSIENFTLRQEAIKWFSGGEDEIYYAESHFVDALGKEINILLLPARDLVLVDADDSVTRLNAATIEDAVSVYVQEKGNPDG